MSSERPFVSLNMASSIDGKITTREREKFRFGSDEDRDLMQQLRSRADAVLIGRGTLFDEDPRLVLTDPGHIARRRQLKGSPQPIKVLTSASLDFPVEDSRFFTCPESEKIVFTTADADPAAIQRLQRFARVVQIPATAGGRVDLEQVVRAMPELGIEHLLLEGGGILNFAMLEADLIDEIYLTLCPVVIGGAGAQTTFEGAGFTRETARRLSLQSLRMNKGGEIFLHYAVKRDTR